MNLANFVGKIDAGQLELVTLDPSNVSPRYTDWMNDPETNRFLESRFELQTARKIRSFVASALGSSDVVLFGIYLQPQDQHLGNIKLSQISFLHLTGEVGFLIGEKGLRGKGYATQAISALSDWAFFELGLEKLTAGCYQENHGSRRALEKAGYHVEAVLENQVLDDSGQRQAVLRLARHRAGSPSSAPPEGFNGLRDLG